MPASMLSAFSGTRSGLPMMDWLTETAALFLRRSTTVAFWLVGAANSSLRFGARTSRETTDRRRTPSSGVSQTPPIFHVETVPEDEQFVDRPAMLKSNLP